MTLSKCVACNSKKRRFIKNQQAIGLSSLEISIPLINKVAILGQYFAFKV